MKKAGPPKFVPNKQGNARQKERPRSVREILGNDPGRVWYPIDPKFVGYEVSNDCYIRSLKLLRKDWGCLIRPKNKTGSKYDMVDKDGNRYELTIEEIKEMAKNNPACVARKTQDCIPYGRNKSMFSNKKEIIPKSEMQAIHQISFTIQDNSSNREVVCPIYSLDGRRY